MKTRTEEAMITGTKIAFGLCGPQHTLTLQFENEERADFYVFWGTQNADLTREAVTEILQVGDVQSWERLRGKKILVDLCQEKMGGWSISAIRSFNGERSFSSKEFFDRTRNRPCYQEYTGLLGIRRECPQAYRQVNVSIAGTLLGNDGQNFCVGLRLHNPHEGIVRGPMLLYFHQNTQHRIDSAIAAIRGTVGLSAWEHLHSAAIRALVDDSGSIVGIGNLLAPVFFTQADFFADSLKRLENVTP